MKIKNKMQLRENITGYLFILPNLFGIIVLNIFALIFSLVISFTDWNMIGDLGSVSFVSWDNYSRMVQDNVFWTSLWNNIWFLLVVPVLAVLAMMCAISLNRLVFGAKPLRIIYFLPHITNMAAILMVWNLLFHPTKGPVNQILMALGIENPPMWLLSHAWAKPAVGLFTIWTDLGFFVLIYLAALQAIPKDLYEAAEIDGASPFRQLRSITIPLISPTTFFVVLLSLIRQFQQWANIEILTGGGPGESTSVLGFYIYKQGFIYKQMGYASAVAWALFIITVAFLFVQWRLQNKWVHY